jgi:hypothetical protein
MAIRLDLMQRRLIPFVRGVPFFHPDRNAQRGVHTT